MDEKEYLQTLGEQIVNPHARASVLAEIQDHIEEQAQDYRASGMSEAVAMQEAVRQMGDPVSTGEALNQVHRPKFPIALFGLAVVLTVLGIAMQYLVYTPYTRYCHPVRYLTAAHHPLQCNRAWPPSAVHLWQLHVSCKRHMDSSGNLFTWSATAMVLRLLQSAVHPLLLSGTGLSAGICPAVIPATGQGGKSHLVPARTNAFVSRPDAFWHNYHLVNGACCRMPDAFAALPCHSSWHTDWQL